jgi:hypothetical protein
MRNFCSNSRRQSRTRGRFSRISGLQGGARRPQYTCFVKGVPAFLTVFFSRTEGIRDYRPDSPRRYPGVVKTSSGRVVHRCRPVRCPYHQLRVSVLLECEPGGSCGFGVAL